MKFSLTKDINDMMHVSLKRCILCDHVSVNVNSDVTLRCYPTRLVVQINCLVLCVMCYNIAFIVVWKGDMIIPYLGYYRYGPLHWMIFIITIKHTNGIFRKLELVKYRMKRNCSMHTSLTLRTTKTLHFQLCFISYLRETTCLKDSTSFAVSCIRLD